MLIGGYAVGGIIFIMRPRLPPGVIGMSLLLGGEIGMEAPGAGGRIFMGIFLMANTSPLDMFFP